MTKTSRLCRICRKPIPHLSRDDLTDQGYTYIEITSRSWNKEKKKFNKQKVVTLSFCPDHTTEEILKRVKPHMGIPRPPSKERIWRLDV